jgi:hypothetical protein
METEGPVSRIAGPSSFSEDAMSYSIAPAQPGVHLMIQIDYKLLPAVCPAGHRLRQPMFASASCLAVLPTQE